VHRLKHNIFCESYTHHQVCLWCFVISISKMHFGGTSAVARCFQMKPSFFPILGMTILHVAQTSVFFGGQSHDELTLSSEANNSSILLTSCCSNVNAFRNSTDWRNFSGSGHFVTTIVLPFQKAENSDESCLLRYRLLSRQSSPNPC